MTTMLELLCSGLARFSLPQLVLTRLGLTQIELARSHSMLSGFPHLIECVVAWMERPPLLTLPQL